MKDWMKATRTDGHTVWLNLPCAITMERDASDNHTTVEFSASREQGHGFDLRVKETPEELLGQQPLDPQNFIA